MTPNNPALRKRWPVLAAIVILVAAALTAGTLFAANERSQPVASPALIEQSVIDATDPGLAADTPVSAAKPQPPQGEPEAGVNQVAPDTGGSDALEQWLSNHPEKMGPFTLEKAMVADSLTVDWLLYQAVHKDVMSQEEADTFQNWYDQRPGIHEAPELLHHQPGYLGRPQDRGDYSDMFRAVDTR